MDKQEEGGYPMDLYLYWFEIWKLDAEGKTPKKKDCKVEGYNIYDAIHQFYKIEGGQKLIMDEHIPGNNFVDFVIIRQNGKKAYFRCVETNELYEKYDPKWHDDWIDRFEEDFMSGLAL